VNLPGFDSRRCTPELADLAASGRLRATLSSRRAAGTPCRPGTPCGRQPMPGLATSAREPARIRLARAADRPTLAEMLSRCTSSTRSRRFFAPLRSFPEPYLTAALAELPEHLALVAATPAVVVALASCCAVDGCTAELAVLVEDARQRQGIGAQLMKRLIEHADRSGLRTLRATLLAEQEWIMRPLRAYGTVTAVMSKGVLEVTVRRPADDRNPGADAQSGF
jgi:GNAT superfamily N-acetyltransferase